MRTVEQVTVYDVAEKYISNDAMNTPVNVILHEASVILKAAQKHAAALFEIGITDSELCHLRKLIARVAAHHRILRQGGTHAVPELRQLQLAKDVILRAVELKFGSASILFREFCSPEGKEAYVYSHSAS